MAFVGVDGGGSRTRALVVDEAGRSLASAEGPGSSLTAVGSAVAARVITDVATEAVTRAGLPMPVSALVAGVAGAGSEALRGELETALRGAGLARRPQVVTDVEVAFHDVFGDGPGVLLVAGTGSIAWGRGIDGVAHRAGGSKGPEGNEGDEGSGYWLVRRAVTAIHDRGSTPEPMHDGREARQDALEEALLRGVDLPSTGELLTWVAGASYRDVAALAPVVIAAAQDGDRTASEIVGRGVQALVLLVETVLEKVGPDTRHGPVALVGGLVELGGPLRGAVEAGLGARGLTVAPAEVSPQRGAADLARRRAED